MTDETTQAAPAMAVASAPVPAGPSGEPAAWDFRRPRAFAPERQSALQVIYGGACKSLERWLTTRVREGIALKPGEFRLVSMEAYAASMTTPTAAYLFDVDAAGHAAIIDFGREFAFYMVDRLLGSNEPPRVADRALTVLERMLVRMAAEQVAAKLAEAWKDHAKLEPRLNRFEAIPAMLQAGNREETMLVAPITVTAGTLQTTFTMALPQAVLESFFAPPLARRGPAAPPPLVPPGAEQSLHEVQVGVSVRTAPFTIRLGELTGLATGSMLQTGLPLAADLRVRVEGITRFLALPGRSGRKLAARITQVLTPAQQMALETKGRKGPMASITQDKEQGGAGPFSELSGSEPGTANPLTSLYQVSLPVTIELGRTRLSVQEVLALGRGSVIELNRMVGEPVEIMVGDRLFAEGEVVVVGENFGVRITRVIPTHSEPGEPR